MRPLKASCQRLARRHAAEESLTFIGHFPLNFPLSHAAPLYLSSVSMPPFSHVSFAGHFHFSSGPSRPFSPPLAQTPSFRSSFQRFCNPQVNPHFTDTPLPPFHLLLLLPPCQAASPLSPPVPALSSVPSSLPAHSVSGPRRPEGRYISHISD